MKNLFIIFCEIIILFNINGTEFSDLYNHKRENIFSNIMQNLTILSLFFVGDQNETVIPDKSLMGVKNSLFEQTAYVGSLYVSFKGIGCGVLKSPPSGISGADSKTSASCLLLNNTNPVVKIYNDQEPDLGNSLYKKKQDLQSLDNGNLFNPEKEEKFQLTIFFVLSAILLAVSVFIFVELRQVSKKTADMVTQRHQSIDMQKEIGASLMNIRFANILEKSLSELKRIEVHSENSKKRKDVRKVIQMLSSAKNTGMQERFMEQFSGLYPGYEKMLLEKHKTLTHNDIKICMLMRLNLSTKEISDILGQSTRTIESSRYRIRKKLGLNSDKDLNIYLMSL